MSTNQNQLSLESALASLAAEAAPLLSGGTDYYPSLNDGTPHECLLNVKNIAGLGEIALSDGHWRLGAAVTWSDLVNEPLPSCFNCLKLAAREIGSIQIQNAATLVGNLCNASPAADGVPALLVLDTKVELRSIDGVRVVPLAEFIIGVRKTVLRANEMVTALLIPDEQANDRTAFNKLGARSYLVISIVMCAMRLRVNEQNIITDAAVAVGACSPVALRLPMLEALLVGKSCEPEIVANCITAEHIKSLTPIADVRATAEYRMQATTVLLQRQLNNLVQSAQAVMTS